MRHPRTLPGKLFAFGLSFGLLTAAALPAQVTFTPGSPPVVELRRLYSLAGLAFPVAGFPVSEQSLAGYAAALAERSADPRIDAGVERYLADLGYRPGRIDIAIRNRFSLEGYLRAGAFPVDYLQSGTPWVNLDFRHEYLEREPLWQLTMTWSRADRAAVGIQGFLHREYLQDTPSWNLPASLPDNPVALENDHVAKGYFWYNFDPLQLEFGRDAVHFGPLRSSLLPSEKLPYLDMLRLTLPIGGLTMDWMVSSPQSAQKADGEPDPDPADDFVFGRNLILANLHRFEYDFGRLRAAVSGFSLFVRPDNYFVLADFFPVFSWHSMRLKPFNLSLVFDLEAALLPGLRVMAQLGFDDISTLGIGVSDSSLPTIWAAIAGAEYVRPLGPAGLTLYAEGGYTHYLWGSYHGVDEPGRPWRMARAIYRLKLDQTVVALPLTSPYGPGAAWAYAEAALDNPRGTGARLFGELVFRKPGVDLLSTPYAGNPALAGAAMEGTLAAGGELRWRGGKWLEVYARPTWFYRAGGGRLELALGATADLDWRRPLPARAASEGSAAGDAGKPGSEPAR